MTDSPSSLGQQRTHPWVHSFEELSAGTMLGRYRIIKLLGRGGMGQVYLVEQDDEKKRYALKILPPEFSERKGFLERFRREQKVMSRLRHEHVVHVLDSGHEHGLYYFVMDFVSAGQTDEPYDLEEALAEHNQFDPATVRALMLQICEGLKYAHSNGVVHRDLKPANILLTQKIPESGLSAIALAKAGGRRTEGRNDLTGLTAKITDFGLAKVVGEEWLKSMVEQSVQQSMSMGQMDTLAEKKRTERSVTEAVLGTYGYMSPEQEDGKPADERSDIYAMGVMMYRMISGERLRGLAEAASTLTPGLDTRWDHIIDRCLELDPRDRFQSVENLQRALLGGRFKKARTRRRKPAGVSKGIVAALVISSILIGIWSYQSKTEATPEQPVSSSPAPASPQPVLVDVISRTQAVAAQQKAHIAFENIRNLKKEWSGFAEQLETIDRCLRNGDTFLDIKRYEEAVAQYELAGKRSETLQEWENDRQDAKTQRTAMEGKRGDAEAQSAQGLASAEWDEAVASALRAEKEFEKGNFREASKGWETAAERFQTSEEMAVAVSGYWKAKQAWGVAINEHKELQKEIERYAPAEWSAAEEAARLGDASANDPTRGKKYYEEALAKYVEAVATAKPYLVPTEGRRWTAQLGSGVEMEFVPIPAGSFMMGSNRGQSDEKPVHRVTLTKPFWMAKTEVTQAQFRRFVSEKKYRTEAESKGNAYAMGKDGQGDYNSELNWMNSFQGEGLPVDCVSWNDSMLFCDWLTERERQSGRLPEGFEYSLPTEAQWEYACRAGSIEDDLGSADALGWFISNSRGKTHPVATKRANAWGLHDMYGNVWEWCSDGVRKYSSKEVVDPKGVLSNGNGVARGGGWDCSSERCWASDRFKRKKLSNNGNFQGFRPILQKASGSAKSLKEVKDASFASLNGLAEGSAEAQAAQRAAVQETGLPLEIESPSTGIKFRLVPAGTFMMGSPLNEENRGSNEKQHAVTISKPFYCGKFEVTQAQWKQVMGTSPSRFQGSEKPVENVSWEDCQTFLKKLCDFEGVPQGTYRLLTEAQWEYACRAGTQTRYCFEDRERMLRTRWNFADTPRYGDETTAPVGRFNPNAWGLYDMHGNVFEWCSDWYGDYPSGSVADPTGVASGSSRVSRGGSWLNDARDCRSALRYRTTPSNRDYYLGFRVVRSIVSNVSIGSHDLKARPVVLEKGGAPQDGREWTANLGGGVEMEFMPIAAGSFQMGSNSGDSAGKPVHTVRLTKPFWLAKTEVTQRQYKQVMGKNPSHFQGLENPVEKVSWNDAVSFCKKLTEIERRAGRLPEGYEYTLPTEAQWEYACRAGTTGKYAGNLDSMAWYSSNSGRKTHPVGTKQANAWGLHDMHGNVWEWCLDDWHWSYSGAPSDGSRWGNGSGSSRVIRGGSWSGSSSRCRSASRSYWTPDGSYRHLGFRVARSVGNSLSLDLETSTDQSTQTKNEKTAIRSDRLNILNVTSRKPIVSGQTVDVEVELECTVSSVEQANVSIGFNTLETNRFRIIRKSKVVEKGATTVTISAEVDVPDYDNAPFRVMAILRQHPLERGVPPLASTRQDIPYESEGSTSSPSAGRKEKKFVRSSGFRNEDEGTFYIPLPHPLDTYKFYKEETRDRALEYKCTVQIGEYNCGFMLFKFPNSKPITGSISELLMHGQRSISVSKPGGGGKFVHVGKVLVFYKKPHIVIKVRSAEVFKSNPESYTYSMRGFSEESNIQGRGEIWQKTDSDKELGVEPDESFADGSGVGLGFTYKRAGDGIEITGYTGSKSVVEIPEKIDRRRVTSIGDKAFYRNRNLRRVEIPSRITRIGDQAFFSCSSLRDIIIPDRVTSIGNNAIQHCTSLMHVTIGKGVDKIGAYAFNNSPNLISIAVDADNASFCSVDGVLFDKSQTELIKYPAGKLGSSYTVPVSVAKIFVGSALQYCPNLTAIEVERNSAHFRSKDGVLFNKKMTEVVRCPGARTGDYAIPSSVTSIGDNAFYGCDGLTNVSIPKSVTNIGAWAFRECTSLNSITIPKGVPDVGFGTFYSCSSLAKVTIPDSVISIENWGFFGCGDLIELSIPGSVAILKDNAFRSCDDLVGLYFQGDEPDLGKDVFDGSDRATVYYPKEKNGWKDTFGGRPTKPH